MDCWFLHQEAPDCESYTIVQESIVHELSWVSDSRHLDICRPKGYDRSGEMVGDSWCSYPAKREESLGASPWIECPSCDQKVPMSSQFFISIKPKKTWVVSLAFLISAFFLCKFAGNQLSWSFTNQKSTLQRCRLQMAGGRLQKYSRIFF